MTADSGRFGSKMATGYFQGIPSVLQFCSHLIGIKYGRYFSNQVKIKNDLRNSYVSIFEPKCGPNLIHKCRPQNLTVAMVRFVLLL